MFRAPGNSIAAYTCGMAKKRPAKPPAPARGRPPKKPADRRSERLTIKLTPGERAGLAAAAGDEDLTVWARDLLLRAAGR